MRLFSLLFALALTVSMVRAQDAIAEPKADESAKPARVFGRAPGTAAAAAPAATPAPKRRAGFFHRLIYGEEHPTPVPATPPPAPVKRKLPIRRATPVPEEETKPTKADPPKGTEKTPGPEKNDPPPATPAPKTIRGTKPGTTNKSASAEQKEMDRAMASGDPDALEKAKYDKVKAAAVADPKVMELQGKADTAGNEEEGRNALRAYNKALFQKMRSLDSSLEPRIDRMESAVLKRLED